MNINCHSHSCQEFSAHMIFSPFCFAWPAAQHWSLAYIGVLICVYTIQINMATGNFQLYGNGIT